MAAGARKRVDGTAVILTNGHLSEVYGKTAHGLIRGTDRYHILAVVDEMHAGRDAGEVLDSRSRGIPVFATLEAALEALPAKPDFCIIGCATHGGVLPGALRIVILEALRRGISIVSGMHEFLSDDPELAGAARAERAQLVDVRKPKRRPHFFEGHIFKVKTPRIAVLGTDCAIGKRTTARMLTEMCNRNGLKAQLVTTGQTGWMQGSPHGFLFDAIPIDFVSGELEHAIVRTAEEFQSDVIFLEGQSALRNPSGPCGSEFILSGGARGVVLQHAPAREFFTGLEEYGCRLPSVADEIALIRMLGAATLAVTLNGENMTEDALRVEGGRLAQEIGVPVALPLEDGVEALLPVVRAYVEEEAQR